MTPLEAPQWLVWAAITMLSVVFALLIAVSGWVWKRLQMQVDNKVDLKAFDEHHGENIKKFEAMLSRMDRAEEQASKHRHHVNQSLGNIALDVAVLKVLENSKASENQTINQIAADVATLKARGDQR